MFLLSGESRLVFFISFYILGVGDICKEMKDGKWGSGRSGYENEMMKLLYKRGLLQDEDGCTSMCVCER